MNTKNIQEKQQLRKRLNPLSEMKQLLSVRQIRQPCKFISMHTANQMFPASANLIVHLHRKVCGCSPGWKAVESMLLPPLHLCCILTP